ncbi:MAG: glycosyltransferase [Povalibacter sp.]
MRFVIFGLSISSSWGNGHATLWRGLCKALNRRGHSVVFFERDQPYYAAARDWHSHPGTELVLYSQWSDISARAQRELRSADTAIVTSYCADAIEATDAIIEDGGCTSVFYDLDTPVTLARLHEGESVAYLGEQQLRAFDLVLSYTGGTALDQLQQKLGAKHVAPLYGHVDPDVHCPAPAIDVYRADLSWLGTFAADRQVMLQRLFIDAALRSPQYKFLLGGAQYPQDFPWSTNIYFVQHVPPPAHAAFFCSSRLTLNVTREAMARMGWCPSGRLFEAAACGAAIATDTWSGLEDFYAPGSEILLAETTQDILDALDMSDSELQRIGQRARERTLDQHTCHKRATELLNLLSNTSSDARAFSRDTERGLHART